MRYTAQKSTFNIDLCNRTTRVPSVVPSQLFPNGLQWIKAGYNLWCETNGGLDERLMEVECHDTCRRYDRAAIEHLYF